MRYNEKQLIQSINTVFISLYTKNPFEIELAKDVYLLNGKFYEVMDRINISLLSTCDIDSLKRILMILEIYFNIARRKFYEERKYYDFLKDKHMKYPINGTKRMSSISRTIESNINKIKYMIQNYTTC